MIVFKCLKDTLTFTIRFDFRKYLCAGCDLKGILLSSTKLCPSSSPALGKTPFPQEKHSPYTKE